MSSRHIVLKSRREIDLMKRSGTLARRILEALGEAVHPGITTLDLDQLARRLCQQAGATPSFIGVPNPHEGGPTFRAAICASVNEAVVHGIPTDRPLEEGDVLSIDFACKLNGWHGDTAWTFAVGPISEHARRLMEVTEQALYEGIKQAKVGNRMGDLGHAVQAYVESHGCTVIRDLVGHGVGRSMWEPPQVPNYGDPGSGAKLRPGMTIAIEPMVAAGEPEVEWSSDGWTVVTKDRSLAAHFEHTVAVTSDGPEILTLLE